MRVATGQNGKGPKEMFGRLKGVGMILTLPITPAAFSTGMTCALEGHLCLCNYLSYAQFGLPESGHFNLRRSMYWLFSHLLKQETH